MYATAQISLLSVWTGGSQLQPWDLVGALGPDLQHRGLLLTPKEKQFVRLVRDACSGDGAGDHQEEGRGEVASR